MPVHQKNDVPVPAQVACDSRLFFSAKIQIFGASTVKLGRDVFPSDGRPVKYPGDPEWLTWYDMVGKSPN